MNKSFRTLATATAVALLTFRVAARGSSTTESPEVTSSTTTKVSTTPSSTKTSVPKSSEESASEITDSQVKRVDEAPDGWMKLSEADDSHLGALEKAGIDVDEVKGQLIDTGRAACADAPEEERQVIVLAIVGQLVVQDHSQDSAEEVAKIIASSAEKAYC